MLAECDAWAFNSAEGAGSVSCTGAAMGCCRPRFRRQKGAVGAVSGSIAMISAWPHRARDQCIR